MPSYRVMKDHFGQAMWVACLARAVATGRILVSSVVFFVLDYLSRRLGHCCPSFRRKVVEVLALLLVLIEAGEVQEVVLWGQN